MITIHACGDSLVTAYGSDENNFIGGWGDHLWSFFEETRVQVNVYAQGGRSSRSYLNEGRFVDNGLFTVNDFPYGMGPVCNRIKPGDYVLLQFCHNDDNSENTPAFYSPWQRAFSAFSKYGRADGNGFRKFEPSE